MGSATAKSLCAISGATLVTLYLDSKIAVLGFQKEKENIREASQRSTSWHPHPYSFGSSGLDILPSKISLSPHPPFPQPSYPPKGYKYWFIPHGLEEESYAATPKF